MSDAKSPQDLSMDEILATIRRIISEDEQSSASSASAASAPRGGAGGAPSEAATAPAGADHGDNLLELTDALNEDGSVRRLAPIGASPSRAERLPEQQFGAAETQAPEPRGEPPSAESPSAESPSAESPSAESTKEPEPRLDAGEPSPAPPPPEPPSLERYRANDERLVSEVTSLAAAAAFARLAAAPRDPPSSHRREPPLVGDQPLDEVVCDLLRPLLRTWLEDNLPGIVEELVRAEIAKIAARSRPG